ncbi:DUF4142 domain-containing protein [Arcicella aquatica]|uniref:DUF4142 domain-containing protein n=1 Tax=Arcicella aquatica TaxID=217141 RepID=A0ABU5QTQ4_9BACT|nr:DUF4142 domain-containing protein [Arcicella aquatica]MEA5260225.1 DUF4142 domain-containing protein [Arcicella aquatica]
MKTTIYLNNTLWFSVVVGCLIMFGFISCNHRYPRPDESFSNIYQAKETTLDHIALENDKEFLVNVAEIDLEEIKLGQLAQHNSQQYEVRVLGKMMEVLHYKSLKNIKAIAKKKSISIPTALSNHAIDTYGKLNKESKSDFDFAFCNIMVLSNKDAIDSLEKVLVESNDLDMIQWANLMLPALRSNLNQAITCKRNAKSSSLRY